MNTSCIPLSIPLLIPLLNPSRLRRLVVALGALTASGAGSANEPQQLPIVVVHGEAQAPYQAVTADSTSRTPVALKDLAASIQVVPREVLRDRGVTRTDQLLDNVSGVLAESSYGGNGATFFNIRGFSENNGLRDGFRNYGYLAFRDVQNIEQVEVFKGPAGALYGGVGAVGGYVNTVSKRPGRENAGELGVTLGGHGLRRGTVDVNRALDRSVSVRLNGAYEKNQTFRDGAAYDAWSLAPAIGWANGRGTSLTVLTEVNHLNRDGFDFGVPNLPVYAQLPRSAYYGARASDYGRNTTRAATVLFDHALNAEWKLRLAAHYSDARQRSQQSFPDIGSYAGGRVLDVSVYSGADEASRQSALQAELVGAFTTGLLTHALLAGIDYGQLAQGGAGSALSALSLDLFHPDQHAPPVPLAAPGPTHQARGKDVGVYVQDLIDIAQGIKLHLGLRADRFDNRELLDGVAVARGTQHALSPRVGVVWQPVTGTALFTDWSRSHAPNVAHSVSSSTYDAEIGEQVEVGIKHDLIAHRLTSTLAVFDLKRANILTSDPLDPTRQVLSGVQASRGVEVDVAGSITPTWKIIAAYTYLDAFVKRDNSLPVGQALSNVPRHHASVWSTCEFNSLRGAGVGGGVVYVGARQANLPNTYLLPGYVRVDGSLFFQRGPWRTQLNVNNLFDRAYYTGGSASVFNYTLAPGQPRTAQLSVSYRY